MELLIYIVKVNLIFCSMYGIYLLFMRRNVFHQWKRFYLLAAPLAALALPFISTRTSSAPLYIVELSALDIGPTHAEVGATGFTLMSILVLIWVTGMFVAIFTAIRNVRASYRSIKGQNVGAFTFLRTISVDPGMEEEVRSKVLVHEQVHADQLHTLDLLWYELLRVTFWFDPVFIMARRSLKELHEYIADREANDRTEDYSETLLANAFGLSQLPLANEFKSNNIKNRISMITKKKSTKQRFALLSSLLLVALAAVSIGWTAISVPDGLGKEKIYDKVETMPLFPGCDASKIKAQEMKKCSMNMLIQFMSATVKYPEKSEKENAEGTVMVKFVVMTDGSIKKAEVVKGVTQELDAEALRVVSTMPSWVPGEHEGEKVNVAVVLPIRFALS